MLIALHISLIGFSPVFITECALFIQNIVFSETNWSCCRNGN
jgi:hypothetical protein